MKKDEIIKTFQDEIEVLHTKFDELKVQANLGKHELKQIIQPEISKIEIQLEDIGKRYKQFSQVSEDAIGDLKEGLSLTLETVSEAVKSASQRFKR